MCVQGLGFRIKGLLACRVYSLGTEPVSFECRVKNNRQLQTLNPKSQTLHPKASVCIFINHYPCLGGQGEASKTQL